MPDDTARTAQMEVETHDGRRLASGPSPAAAVWDERDVDRKPENSAGPRAQLHLGLRPSHDMPTRVSEQSQTGMRWTFTKPQTHILAVGPSRSDAGKTASILIPVVLSQFGPVVTASTKDDIYTATAMARAQYGQVWHYSPDGGAKHLSAGVRELRWSPLSGATTWGGAISTTTAMETTSATGSGMTDANHWRMKAEQLLAPVFYWAARTDRSMQECYDVVKLFDVRSGGVLADLERLAASATTEVKRAEAHQAATELRSVIATPGRERGSVVSTAQTTLKAYRHPAALASTVPPNFDVDAFVHGSPIGPDGDVLMPELRADTIYITAGSDKQEEVAPLVVALLDQIRAATFRRHREFLAPLGPNTPDVWPVCMVLDELAGLTPLPQMPEMLRAGGSQGLLIVGAVQNLSSLKARWPNPNTVQLVTVDGVGRVVFGLRPGGVGGAFDVPFGHLAFDDAWGGSV